MNSKSNDELAQQPVVFKRLIGHLKGHQPGPTTIFMGGIHGNEPAGVMALENVMQELSENLENLNGSVYAINGNLPALRKGVRFIDHDLNRLWTFDRIKRLRTNNFQTITMEEKQQVEILQIIDSILENEQGPFYFFDLHTTSCKTIPFLTVNDMRINRRFAEQYPVPMILGIEEYLEGPILSYINELGYVAFGFEGGQHNDPAAVNNHSAFIQMTLRLTGNISHEDVAYRHARDILKKAAKGIFDIYEIFFRHEVIDQKSFEMLPDFVNFQTINAGQSLARSQGEMVNSTAGGRLFMPLYQKQGEDGFFIIRPIQRWILHFSDLLRRWKMEEIFSVLPGIQWESPRKETLIINKRIARFFTREIFHLFGYRYKVIDQTTVRMKNRESVARTGDYAGASWYKRN
jgi:succinylglutamate desuccinylase